MLTIFTAPKPFRHEFEALQRNAITSWTRMVPRPEILVFGDEPGTAEACRDLSVTHVPEIRRNDLGTPLVSDLFHTAEARGRGPLFCYVNADVIFLDDFSPAVAAAQTWARDFLMIGQRCTVEVPRYFEFSGNAWALGIRDLAKGGRRDSHHFIDYFVFSRGLFGEIPPFAIGRAAYDNWLVWRALQRGVPVIDTSDAVLAVHQMHGYGHIAGGKDESYGGREARRNLELAGGVKNLRFIGDATHAMTPERVIVPARGEKYVAARRERRRRAIRNHPWFTSTQSLRRALGLRRSNWDAVIRGWKRIRG